MLCARRAQAPAAEAQFVRRPRQRRETMARPEDSWTVGGDVDRVTAALRVGAPDLDPDVVTGQLGVQPTFAARRGDTRPSKSGTITQKAGVWVLEAPRSTEWVLRDAIAAILDRLPAAAPVWDGIARLATIDMFCGLHLDDFSRGLDLPAELLGRLAERHIGLTIDIYCEGSDEADA